MDRTTYRESYLHSEHWKQKREEALERAEGRCQVCYAAKGLDVHHRTYERLGDERPADLTVLCRRCHDLFHGSSKLKVTRPKKTPKTKRRQKVCECGCGATVRNRFAPGHSQRMVKAKKKTKDEHQRRRQEVWDAIVNR